MKKYALKLPVLHRICANCEQDYVQHVDGKCLFEATNYAPGRTETVYEIVNAGVPTGIPSCPRCGDTEKDPEHEGPCGACMDVYAD
jgi:ribosomal protein S27AE